MTINRNNPEPTEPLTNPVPKSWIVWSLRQLLAVLDAGKRSLMQVMEDLIVLVETAKLLGYDPDNKLEAIGQQVYELFPTPSKQAMALLLSAYADSLDGMDVVFHVVDNDKYDDVIGLDPDSIVPGISRVDVVAGSPEERELLAKLGVEKDGGEGDLAGLLAGIEEGLSMLDDINNGVEPEEGRVRKYVADTLRGFARAATDDCDRLTEIVVNTETIATQAAEAGLCSPMQLVRMAMDARRDPSMTVENVTKYVRDVASYIEGAGQSAQQVA